MGSDSCRTGDGPAWGGCDIWFTFAGMLFICWVGGGGTCCCWGGGGGGCCCWLVDGGGPWGFKGGGGPLVLALGPEAAINGCPVADAADTITVGEVKTRLVLINIKYM